jgi:hypothetical protein
MRLYDCEQSAQEDMIDKTPERDYNEEKPKKNFEGFKF